MTALVSRGDLDAAATLIIERHGPAVLDYLRSWLRNDDDAAEAFSWFTEHVWSGLHAYRADAALRTWVYRIAHNAAVDRGKQAWRRREQRLTMRAADALVDEEAEAKESRRDRHECFEELRQHLTGEERTLLILRIDHELPWDEIVHVISREGRPLDATTVIKRFKRLTGRLRRMARQRGLLR